VDVFFDHLLAKRFEEFSAISLEDFSERTYETYSRNKHVFPESSDRFLEYVLKNNIYASYALPEGIEKVLYHLSHRIGHDVRLDYSVRLFERNEKELQKAFTGFMKDAIAEFNPA
jgi:acyl carrier protein phosphodiesterase